MGTDEQIAMPILMILWCLMMKTIKWSRNLKRELTRNKIAEYTEHKVRNSLYRPFTKSHLFFDSIMNNEVAHFPTIFPTPETEKENRVICVSSVLEIANLFNR